MTWLNRISNQELIIRTGDGSEFRPIWKNARKSRNLNASKFEFNNQQGSFIRRGEASGLDIPFEFHFQGENNIDEASRFDRASLDRRPWTLIHPLYDELLVHPVSISFDDTNQNVTKVTGTLWETIQDTFPDATIDVQEEVLTALESITETIGVNYAEQLTVPETQTIAETKSFLNKLADKFRAAAKTSIDLENVENAVSETLAALDSINTSAQLFMDRAARLARTPARFYDTVQNRINALEESFQDLKLSVQGLSNFQNKLFFESMGGALTAAKAETSVLPITDIAEEQDIENNILEDYQTRNEVINVANSLETSIREYLDTLGTLQSDIDAQPGSYTPSVTTVSGVKDAVNKASGQLPQIALEAKQERKYTVPQPIGIIPLVHRLLGNTLNATIEEFIRNNEIRLEEYLQIDKGREVIYFI